MEVWKDIPGYEGRYQASSFGRIKSLPNRTRKSELILKPSLHVRGGYPVVNLTSRGINGWKQRLHPVHELVLVSFHGERPDGCEGCHGDGDPTNNRAANLRWGTPGENQQDRVIHGTTNHGEMNGRAKLTLSQVKEIKRLLSCGYQPRVIAPDFDVAVNTIKSIKQGVNWGWVK